MTRIGTKRTAFYSVLGSIALVLVASLLLRGRPRAEDSIGMAVEFTNHAAAAYVAQDNGWYAERGMNLAHHGTYVTGMALASALARRDVQVAYMCLVPAISAYANAGVPLKIVAGTHKYGYALVVDPDVVTRIEDLEKVGIRLGSVREGGAVDILMNRTIEEFQLDRAQILGRVRRMNPPAMLLALEAGQLDAAFLPEHWVAMTEDLGFEVLLTAQDVWPGMQGSVLIVKEELVRSDPDWVRELVAVNEEATRWIEDHPARAAEIVARALSISGVNAAAADLPPLATDISAATMRRSMGRLEYTSAITAADVQEVIEYAVRLGYIRDSFPAEEILDTSFMQ